MTTPVTFELAVQDPYGIWAATHIQPDRIELCSGLAVGGVTPSRALIETAVASGLEVHVLIRPRAGDFEFDHHAIELMHLDINHALAAGARGVVVGASKQGKLDRNFIADVLQQVAGRAEVTIHRVIDVVTSPEDELDWIASQGIARVLTSGAADSAAKGMNNLARYVAGWQAELTIMAGGGVRLQDLPALREIGVAAIHTSAKKTVAGPPGVQLGTDASEGALSYDTTDLELAREFKQELSSQG